MLPLFTGTTLAFCAKIPAIYILPIWTKDAEKDIWDTLYGNHCPPTGLEPHRISTLTWRQSIQCKLETEEATTALQVTTQVRKSERTVTKGRKKRLKGHFETSRKKGFKSSTQKTQQQKEETNIQFDTFNAS